MKDTIYISGHKNPDADSICSAIAYATFKSLTDNNDKTYIPIRLGKINAETKFILDYFKVDEPILMDTVKLKVSDLDYSDVASLTPNVSIAKAQKYLEDNNIDYISVVDKSNKLCGMLTISSLNKIYTEAWQDNILFDSKTTIENIVEALDAEIQCVYSKYFPGKILIAAMSDELIRKYANQGDIVIVGDREDILSTLIDIGVSLIIMTGDTKMNDDLLLRAKKNNVTVISAKKDSLTVSRLLLQSIPVSYVMASENLISFSMDDLVKDIKGVMVKTRHRAFPVIDEANHVLGIISRHGLLSKDRKQIIQVDHNEYAQSIDGIEEAEIVEAIDHHRVADIQTSYPIFFRNEPVGSTSTIIAEMFFERNIPMTKEIAGLLMSGILSDTLIFKSPTCTQIDIDICHRLAPIAGISDIKAYALEMQKAATRLDNRSVSDIFNSDFKEFKISKSKIGISQMNTLDIAGFSKMKDEMLTYMQNKLNNEGYDAMLLLLTDIINEGSLFIATGKTNIVEESFNVKLNENEIYIPGILSRKKQVVPALSKYLEEDNF